MDKQDKVLDELTRFRSDVAALAGSEEVAVIPGGLTS